MKKILFLSLLIYSASVSGQNPIPNPGFENWQYTAFWTIEADGWWSNNSEVAAWNVIPDSLAHTGNLALNLQNLSYRGSIFTGFPILNRPDYLSGYVKNLMSSPSEATVTIVLYDSGMPVDSGSMVFYGGPVIFTYQPFSIPISQNQTTADSAVITIHAGSDPQSVISFDDLSFDGPSWIPDQENETNQVVFPNPAHGALNIYYHDGTIYTARLLDASGKLIEEAEGLGHSFPYQTFAPVPEVMVIDKEIEPGVYFLHIHSKINSIIQRVVYVNR